MKVKDSGKYKYFTETLYVSIKNESYVYLSHVYVMDNGESFVKYEKRKY